MLSPPMKHRIFAGRRNKLHRFFKGYCYAAQKIKAETNAPKERYLVFLFSSCQLQLKQAHDLSPAQESFLMFFKLSLQHLQLLRKKKNKMLWTKCANNWTLFLLTFQSATGICVLQFWDMEDGRLKNETPERHAPHPAAPKNLQRCLFHNTHTQTQASPWIRGPF